MKDATWKLPQVEASHYSGEQAKHISCYEKDLACQLRNKQKRLAHSLSVAATAEVMAQIYDEDPYEARVAGILHDWAKAYPDDLQRAYAQKYGINLGVDPLLVTPLLHGMVAARELPARYPELSDRVLQAIDRHTTGAPDMTPLDMIVFVADGIEPLRKSVPSIEKVRRMVESKEPLSEVFWTNFCAGVVYVIETQRYLWPGTLDVYNSYAIRNQSR